MSHTRDLRTWLHAVEQMDELVVAEGADWDLEIGAISRLNYRQERPRAVLFDGIVGYPPGFRVLTGSISNPRRLGFTLGFGSGISSRASLVAALEGCPERWEAQAADHAARVVDTGPVTENVIDGEDVDLSMFPAPKWNEHDGGRYIGTGCIAFTSDPETGVVNGGAYRMQLQDEGRTATMLVGPGKHGRQNIDRWLARGERVPVTVSFGHDPLLLVVAGTEVPTGVSELDYAGAVLGEPLEVVTGEQTGLPIPAGSEIAVEGYLNPERTFDEGPFAEWTGHYTGGGRQMWSLDIERIYHRDDPIILGAPPGKPPHDYSFMRSALKSAMVQSAIRSSGVPGVGGVWAHEAGGGRMFIAVAIEQRYFGHSRQAGYIAANCHAAAYLNRFVVVVDDDVDPYDLDDVVWAACTRCDPATDIEIMRKMWGGHADPILADKRAPYNSRALIDACRPFEQRDAYPRLAEMSSDLKRATTEKWAARLGMQGWEMPEAR